MMEENRSLTSKNKKSDFLKKLNKVLSQKNANKLPLKLHKKLSKQEELDEAIQDKKMMRLVHLLTEGVIPDGASLVKAIEICKEVGDLGERNFETYLYVITILKNMKEDGFDAVCLRGVYHGKPPLHNFKTNRKV